MLYKNNNFSYRNFLFCFISVVSASALIDVIFPGFFRRLFFTITVLVILLFILLFSTFHLHSNKTLIVSNKFISVIFVIVLIFLWMNAIFLLFTGLIRFSIVEFLTASVSIQDVFYTIDGFNFPELKYITLFNCLIKSLLFLLISVLILILHVSINFKSSCSLFIDSISIQIVLIISNLAFIIYMKSFFLKIFLRLFGFTFNGFPCEILIHNYNFFCFFFGVFLYLIITILLLVLPLTSTINITLALVKEILFLEFIYCFCYFQRYTMTHTDCSDVFISYPFLRSFLTEEIYSFPLNIIWF